MLLFDDRAGLRGIKRTVLRMMNLQTSGLVLLPPMNKKRLPNYSSMYNNIRSNGSKYARQILFVYKKQMSTKLKIKNHSKGYDNEIRK
jgi:hypothetical protein